jgi:hypothetical protein
MSRSRRINEADRCFRLAAEIWDEKAQSALISYRRELEAEADRVEAAERSRRAEAGGR